MKLSVVIPIYNEEKTVLKVINKVFSQKEVYEIIAVDDGSNDNTYDVLESVYSAATRTKKKRLRVLRHRHNFGKGAAIQTALKNVSGDFAIIQDADLEYNPKEYKELLKVGGQKVVVYGSRILRENPHAYTRTYLGNVLITFFNNLLFGSRLTDIYTCYKLIPTKVAKSLNLSSLGFEIEAEITAKLLKKNIRILEVPISYRPRSYEQGKKIKTKDAIRGAWVLLSVWLGLKK